MDAHGLADRPAAFARGQALQGLGLLVDGQLRLALAAEPGALLTGGCPALVGRDWAVARARVVRGDGVYLILPSVIFPRSFLSSLTPCSFPVEVITNRTRVSPRGIAYDLSRGGLQSCK